MTELDTVIRRPRLDPGHEKTSTLIGILAASEHAEALAEWLAGAPPAEDMRYYQHLVSYLAVAARKRHDRGEDVSRPYLNREGEAALLGVKPGTVTRYRDRDPSYPAPVECPCCGSSVRDRVAVEAWRDSRPGQGAGGGRPPRKEQS